MLDSTRFSQSVLSALITLVEIYTPVPTIATLVILLGMQEDAVRSTVFAEMLQVRIEHSSDEDSHSCPGI
jgi:hypothetical protein